MVVVMVGVAGELTAVGAAAARGYPGNGQEGFCGP